ncbi:MAG: DinB family protein [Dehalococcoidia bacterium]|nr:DinB family protein [Dehalococcoidia bacterium]
MNDPLAQMFRYNAWANATLLAACRDVPGDRLDIVPGGTFGSIRDTLLHFIGSQDAYLSHLAGGGPDLDRWWRDSWMGLDVLSERATASSARLVEAAESLETDADVTFGQEYGERIRARKSALLVQALQHATEHREQICATLTHLGIQPPDLSGWAWGEATGAVEELES